MEASHDPLSDVSGMTRSIASSTSQPQLQSAPALTIDPQTLVASIPNDGSADKQAPSHLQSSQQRAQHPQARPQFHKIDLTASRISHICHSKDLRLFPSAYPSPSQRGNSNARVNATKDHRKRTPLSYLNIPTAKLPPPQHYPRLTQDQWNSLPVAKRRYITQSKFYSLQLFALQRSGGWLDHESKWIDTEAAERDFAPSSGFPIAELEVGMMPSELKRRPDGMTGLQEVEMGGTQGNRAIAGATDAEGEEEEEEEIDEMETLRVENHKRIALRLTHWAIAGEGLK